MPQAVWAGVWGLVGGSALVIGALAAYVVDVPTRVVAAVMAFGSGVLISALSFDLMQEAFRIGGFAAAATGFLVGGAIYTAANIYISRRGGHSRKRSGTQQQNASEGSGIAIAVGALLDGIPESLVIGISLLTGPGVSLTAVAAVFLSNVPEGLSSAAGMRKSGRSPAYVFGVWLGIALASAVASIVGYVAFAGAAPEYVAGINALAAGAILAMIADTMIPEGFAAAHEYAGFITAFGFLLAFALSKLSGA